MALAILQARRDPNRFIPFCFRDATGTILQQARVHVALQHFLSQHSKALIELPRDHGKSVQVCGRILWELGHKPGLRVKLVCATDALAAERSRFLRDTIETNARLRLVFPLLKPGQSWSADVFTIQRLHETIGPSVAAFGIGSGATGARADLLVCDDVVDVRALHSPGERQRCIDVFQNNLVNLLEPDGRFWGLCTPWHPEDLNAYLKRNSAYALFRRAVGPNMEPVWPEKWNRDALMERQIAIGTAAFARGYRLLPIHEGEIVIRPEWVRFWNEEVPRECLEFVVLSIDPAVSSLKKADASALVVAGRLEHSNDVRVLESQAHRVSTPDLMHVIADVAARWNPDAILFESNAAFAGIRDLMQRHASFGSKVQGIVQTRSKAARAAALSVPIQNGTVKLRGENTFVDGSQRALFEEVTMFPFALHDDLLDALASAVEFLLQRRPQRIWV